MTDAEQPILITERRKETVVILPEHETWFVSDGTRQRTRRGVASDGIFTKKVMDARRCVCTIGDAAQPRTSVTACPMSRA